MRGNSHGQHVRGAGHWGWETSCFGDYTSPLTSPPAPPDLVGPADVAPADDSSCSSRPLPGPSPSRRRTSGGDGLLQIYRERIKRSAARGAGAGEGTAPPRAPAEPAGQLLDTRPGYRSLARRRSSAWNTGGASWWGLFVPLVIDMSH